MTTATGQQLAVLECRTLKIEADTKGIGLKELHNVYMPLEVPELWQGPECFQLTNALRLLQVVTKINGSTEYVPDMKPLRTGFNPRDLLVGTGLEETTADAVIRTLKRMDLLLVRESGSKPIYYVHTTFRGIGPERQKLTKAELVNDWILPGITRGDKKEELMGAAARRLQENREKLLTLALIALRTRGVPSEKEPGWFEAILDTSVKAYLAVELNVTEGQANRLFEDLGILGLVKTTSRGPQPALIHISGAVEELTEADVEKIRAIRKGDTPAPPAPPPTRKDETAESQNGVVEATPEHLNELFEQLGTRLDAYAADRDAEKQRADGLQEQVTDLERQLAEKDAELTKTREELEAARTPVFRLPEALAKHLESV